MSRSRDISKFLGKTETANTSNLGLVNSGENVGLDSAQITTIAEGQGLASYTNLDSLPVTGLTAGDQAYVQNDRRLYISNGSGWYNVALANATPYWDSEPLTTYEIVDSVTPLIIIAKARDSDNSDQNLLHQSTVTDSAQYLVDITRDSSVYTFTPKTADSIGASVTAGDLTDSNTNDFIYTFKWSDGINFVSKAVTINYNIAVIYNTIADARAAISTAQKMTIDFSDIGETEVWVHPTYGALYASFGIDNTLDATNEPAFAGNALGYSGINNANGFTIGSSGNLYYKNSQASNWVPSTTYDITTECFGFFGSAAATANITATSSGWQGPSGTFTATCRMATSFDAGSSGFQGTGNIVYIDDAGGTNNGALVDVETTINTSNTNVFRIWEDNGAGYSITFVNSVWIR